MACLESLGIGLMAGVLISAIVALTAIILHAGGFYKAQNL